LIRNGCFKNSLFAVWPMNSLYSTTEYVYHQSIILLRIFRSFSNLYVNFKNGEFRKCVT